MPQEPAPAFTHLPATVSTLYAELLAQSIQAEMETVVRGLPSGTFVSKEIRGRTYWYLQQTVGAQQKQHYLGPDSEALRAGIAEARTARVEALARERLCAMLRAGGATTESAAVGRVFELLAEASVFRRGGVLIGTHAFAVYGNLLGVRLAATALRTQDIDIAQDPAIAVAILGEVAPTAVEEHLRASFAVHPIPALDPRKPSTSFKIRGQELRIDFVTPLRGREQAGPIYLPAFKVSAHPLRFLDYLIAHPVQAAVVGKTSILVNIPQPARFAFHKLWVAEERGVSWQTRAQKDLLQANLLFALLLADRPGDLQLAWEALGKYPQAKRRIEKVIAHFPPELREPLRDLCRP